MSLTADHLKRLAAIGVTVEQIAVMVEIMEERDAVTRATASAAAPRSKEAIRSKRYRENQKAAARDGKRDGVTVEKTIPPRPSNITTLFQEDSGKGDSGKPNAREKRGKSKFPADFKPNDTVEAIARESKFSVREWESWLADHKDYWMGCGRMMVDWQAVARQSIRRWIRINRKGNTNGSGAAQRPTNREAFFGALDLIDAKYGTGETSGGGDLLLLPGLGKGP